MFLISFIRWIKGTVTFIITGAFPERFISSCRRNGFNLWNVKRDKTSFFADTYAADYKKLRHAARQSSVKIRITDKKGLFTFLKRYRKRAGIPVGVGMAVLMLIFASSRIWKIEISGCSEEVAEAVKQHLFQNGINTGCSKNEIDVKDIQGKIVLEDDRIAWIAINVVGSTAYVEVSERIQPPERLDPDNKYSNIVALCDGQIKYLEVYSGQAMVKVGETVSKGDILVSGIMEDKYGKKQFKYARAKIIARVEEQKEAEVPLKQSQWIQTDESHDRWFIELLSRQIPVYGLPIKQTAFSLTEERKDILFFDLVKKTYTPQRLKTIILTEQQAKENAMRMLDQYDKTDESEKCISRSRIGQLSNGIYTVTEARIVEKNIAVTKDIEWQIAGDIS